MYQLNIRFVFFTAVSNKRKKLQIEGDIRMGHLPVNFRRLAPLSKS